MSDLCLEGLGRSVTIDVTRVLPASSTFAPTSYDNESCCPQRQLDAGSPHLAHYQRPRRADGDLKRHAPDGMGACTRSARKVPSRLCARRSSCAGPGRDQARERSPGVAGPGRRAPAPAGHRAPERVVGITGHRWTSTLRRGPWRAGAGRSSRKSQARQAQGHPPTERLERCVHGYGATGHMRPISSWMLFTVGCVRGPKPRFSSTSGAEAPSKAIAPPLGRARLVSAHSDTPHANLADDSFGHGPAVSPLRGRLVRA